MNNAWLCKNTRIICLITLIILAATTFLACSKWPDPQLRAQLVRQMAESGLDSSIVRAIAASGDSAVFAEWERISGINEDDVDSGRCTEEKMAEYIKAWTDGGRTIDLSRTYGRSESGRIVNVCRTESERPDMLSYVGDLDGYWDVSQLCLTGAKDELSRVLSYSYNSDKERALNLARAYGSVASAAWQLERGYTYIELRLLAKSNFYGTVRHLNTAQLYAALVDSLVTDADKLKTQCGKKRMQYQSLYEESTELFDKWNDRFSEAERKEGKSQLNEILK